MKQKDIFALAIIVIVAAVFSFIAANAIFDSSKQRKLKVPVVQTIEGTFPSVKTESSYQAFFNDKALNPTQLIQIGTSNNPLPFTSGGR